MLTAVVTQTGEAFQVHLTQTVPPTNPDEETTTTEGETPEAETGHGVKQTDDGLVATGDIAHVGVDEAAPGPNPILPELKEVAWGAGAFIVFAVIMRYFAYPKLRAGMDARYNSIRADHESADAMRAGAQAEVAEYQAQLAVVKAEVAAKIDAARQQLESERSARLAEVNAGIAEQRAAAAAESEAARAAVHGEIAAAVADVASTAIRAAIGADADPAVVDRVVADLLSAGVAR